MSFKGFVSRSYPDLAVIHLNFLQINNCVAKQRYIQVFKFGGLLDSFLKDLGIHCKILGVQLINIQELIFDLLPLTVIGAAVPFQISKLHKNKVLSLSSKYVCKIKLSISLKR